MRDLSDIFKLNPDDVIKYFDDKLPKDYDLDKLRFSAYNRTFLISGINEIETLKRMHSILKNAYMNGTSFKNCVEELKNASGLHKNHLRVVFHQNMRQVYSFARYEKQLISDKPYLRYVAIMDNRVRDSHKKFHGLILPKEHPFWRNNYPPNGWGCRCKTQVLSLDEAKALGFKENEKDKRSSLNAAVRGFDNNPIEPNNALFKVLEEKVKTAPEGLRKQAEKIMNEAYKSTQEHKKSFELLKKAFNNEQNLFKKSGLSLKEYKEQAIKRSKKLKKKARDTLRICITKFNNRPVYIDKFQIATHLHHKEISAYDYSLIGQILKKGKQIEADENNKDNKICIQSILGRKYILVFKDLEDGYYVSSLRFEH